MSAVPRRRRSTLVAGSGIARAACARVTTGRRTVVVVDARLAPLAEGLARPVAVVPIEVGTVDAATVAALADRLADVRAESVVAVGGGTVLDAVAVAALGPATVAWALQRAEGAAVVPLPAPGHRPIEVVAVPTTVGTSAETNAVAIVRTRAGARVLVGEAVRPRYAVLDATHYATLDATDVRAGCLEALLRLAGVSTADRAHPRAHAHAVAIARALLAAGHSALTPACRLRIARLSAATQRSAALRGRAPFSPRHWYLANEVSFVARTTKMRATASVVSRVWQRIEDGDTRWGSAEPLEAFWREATRDARLPLAPAAGIDALIARWGLPLAPRPHAEAREAMAVRAERWWGGRGTALSGLSAPDVRDVLDRARWDPNPPAEASRLRPTHTSTPAGGGEHI
ncbi:iron-containing alcohol dehydrogenase [Microbacterium sp. SLBN-111]|uniref:iron-containing alcohol dehydrogenase n=1 Tax=Microbacterium sp. SLBN-111 TaxID=3377733 RepID=UPI003C7764F7